MMSGVCLSTVCIDHFFHSFYGLDTVAYLNSKLKYEAINPFRHLVGFLVWAIGPFQSLYLHTKTRHKKVLTNINVFSGTQPINPVLERLNTAPPDLSCRPYVARYRNKIK
jgi:hypothetical protein